MRQQQHILLFEEIQCRVQCAQTLVLATCLNLSVVSFPQGGSPTCLSFSNREKKRVFHHAVDDVLECDYDLMPLVSF